jgi:oxygen-independent coproporphyrinogen-3 oxidase
MLKKTKFLWKPVVQKAISGHWERFRMLPIQPPVPRNIKRAGLYLHVPFCMNLCPFCPYNRVRYECNAFGRYEKAVYQEIDMYAPHLEGIEFVSLYIGGGTPTVNLDGLIRILKYIKSTFSLTCDICIELYPGNMEHNCLDALREAGVTMISIGIESTSDHVLKRIGRNHDGKSAISSLRRAEKAGFDSVNVDLMFALPDQTISDWEADLRVIMEEQPDQISTYPLFSFPYSKLGQQLNVTEVKRPDSQLVRTMLKLTDQYATENRYERCAVWSWIKTSKKKFSSITRHHYVGFGPSAASMIGSHFYVNTFNVDAYASALPSKPPIALSMPVDKRLEMAYWLYWRVYELHIEDVDFKSLFGEDESLEVTFGKLFNLLQLAGMVKKEQDNYQITSSGAYWIHRLQNEYSLNYINRLWGACMQTPWPEKVLL